MAIIHRYWVAVLMSLCVGSCSDEMRVRITNARPDRGPGLTREAPLTGEFCFPRAYSDRNFAWVSDAGAVSIKFLQPSLEPAGRDRTPRGFVQLLIWPGPGDGPRIDYSRLATPTYGEPVRHPHMVPEAIAVQQNASVRVDPVSPIIFPSFASDTYTIIPVDEAWRQRVQVRCWRISTAAADWCNLKFQTRRGFMVDVGTRAENMFDLPSLMLSVETLVERFYVACER